MIIGIVAGVGSFALIFVNWLMVSESETDVAAPTQPALQQEQKQAGTPTEQKDRPAE